MGMLFVTVGLHVDFQYFEHSTSSELSVDSVCVCVRVCV